MTLFEELKWRGLIKDITSPELEEKLNKGGMTFYIGTDPTADSMHIGHLSSFLITKRLKDAGHTPILLVGGGTGLIGDPKATSEREKKSREEIEKNYLGLRKQVEKIFGFEVVNNLDWYKDINVVDFLRDYGKYFTINYMLDKDTVRRRLESGISFTEFSYMILQALDFMHLHQTKGVDLQVAGSDQWGNITAGVDLIKKATGDTVYAFTMPLVTDSRGVKFGKSEGNALWLDKNKTSSYELYQFFVNVEDSMVIDYLKIYTFLDKETIEEYERKNNEAPHLREAHKRLAEEIITFLHGHDEYLKALHISESLFNGNIKELNEDELNDASKNMDSFELNDSKNIVDLLVESKICQSKREAREFILNNSISINGEKINDLEYIICKELALYNKYTIIRKGKKKYFVIRHL